MLAGVGLCRGEFAGPVVGHITPGKPIADHLLRPLLRLQINILVARMIRESRLPSRVKPHNVLLRMYRWISLSASSVFPRTAAVVL
jgi:hypothetical protein